MSVLSDVQKFISDLVLGDFAQNPSSASIVVNGAIGLIPIVDQVLDARDVTAQVLLCSKKGWANLQEDDYANLAFTAIGLIPSFGSFFKGAVKPLWRDRKLVGRGVQSGVAMLERALGMGKGGVIKWVNAINWAQRRQQTATAAQAALDSYIGMLQAIAQDPWWVPDGLARQARTQIPAAEHAKLYVSQAVERGTRLIESFLKDLLGEHAVWVQVAASAAQASAKTSHKPGSANKVVAKANTTATDKRKGQPPSTSHLHAEQHKDVGGNKQTQAKPEKAPVSVVQQKTRNFIQSLSERPMALLAEHMVDYHVLKLEGASHPHGSEQVQTSGFRKVNSPKRPNELIGEDLSRVFTQGIDSLWLRPNAKYLVVEAKGRIGAPSSSASTTQRDGKKSNDKIPAIPAGAKLTDKQAQLWRMLHDNSDKGGAGAVMQMSRAWIEKDLNELVGYVPRSDYERRVYLVAQYPKPAEGLLDHMNAVTSALSTEKIDHSQHQATHGVSVEYLEADIAAVEEARRDTSKDKSTEGESPVPRTGTGRSPRKTGRN